jgi:uncharacterized protein YacL
MHNNSKSHKVYIFISNSLNNTPLLKRAIRKTISTFPKSYQDLFLPEQLPHLSIRVFLGLSLALLIFNVSYFAYFDENRLFGVPFLGELLLSLSAAAIGFHTIPITFIKLKYWFQQTVSSTLKDAAGEFILAQKPGRVISRGFDSAFVLDTSVLIDGRILNIVKSGFIYEKLIILDSVINELHLLADSENKLKRERARRGLDIINSLKKVIEVSIEKGIDNSKGVDNDLVLFCKNKGFRLVTMDYNLNKVAKAKGIPVLNINALNNALKAYLIPGDVIEVEVIKQGEQANQGLAYLEDGTLIIIEKGFENIGEKISVKIKKNLQTSAGTLYFARKVS